MRSVNETVTKQKREIKILQFGEGNFLRGFVDYMVDIANEKGVFDGSVAIVKPIEFGSLDALNAQDCVYTVLLRGKQDGKIVRQSRVVTCVDKAVDAYSQYAELEALIKLPSLRFVVSNTTEAGIVYDESDSIKQCPPATYPGKLTKLLYERFKAFGGDPGKGLIILPVELIEKNGDKLLDCCLRLARRWDLPESFSKWLREGNEFCSTLVDRIITGYPKDEAAALENEMGYIDSQLVTGEPFALWVIQSVNHADIAKELPLDKAGLPVIFTDDLTPYRERKVRILNGAHTSTVLAAYLSGLDAVGELMGDKTARGLMEKAVYSEISPNVKLPADEVKAFADSVMERFENPFIRHSLLAISLNSVSKFKARVLPSIKDDLARTGSLPDALTFSLAALMAFYSGEKNPEGRLTGKRGDGTYEIMDDASVLDFFHEKHVLSAEDFTRGLLSRTDFWGENLNDIPGLRDKVSGYLQSIRDNGISSAAALLA